MLQVCETVWNRFLHAQRAQAPKGQSYLRFLLKLDNESLGALFSQGEKWWAGRQVGPGNVILETHKLSCLALRADCQRGDCRAEFVIHVKDFIQGCVLYPAQSGSGGRRGIFIWVGFFWLFVLFSWLVARIGVLSFVLVCFFAPLKQECAKPQRIMCQLSKGRITLPFD